MARILYGVAGEGSGHSSRAKEVISHLLEQGLEVKIISHDRGYVNLKKYFSDIEEIFGLRFDYKNNRVRPSATIWRNLLKLPQARASMNKVIKIIEQFKPQIVISDFEPLSCLAANLKKLPLISIDNQHRLTNTKIDYPKKYAKDAVLAKAVVSFMIYNSLAYLVISFDQNKIIKPNTFLFPPILRQEVIMAKSADKDYILVYLTSEFDSLIPLLKSISKHFIVYGFNKKGKDGNVIFKQASQKVFLNDLANCQAVIANAGFTLISEALYLRKPYLALPVSGQFEQVLNGYTLEKLGYGKYYDELDKEKIESFLFNLNLYKNSLRKYQRQDNHKIFAKLDQLVKKYA